MRKPMRAAGEDLKHAISHSIAEDRRDRDRTDAENPASFAIHTWIAGGIVGADREAATQALAGKAGVGAKLYAEIGRRADSGATDHLLSITQCERDAVGAR